MYAVTVLVAAILGAILIGSADDASIGGGALVGVVFLLGLPWSLIVFAVEDGLGGSIPGAIVLAAFAVVNALIVVSWRLRTRRGLGEARPERRTGVE
ncbi:MAG: hypothetical protein ACXVEC_14395 [Nocardioides sp.]